MKKIAIFWFRRDLRLEDNPGLFYALQGNFPVLPLFIFDTDILDKLEGKKDARVQFIHGLLMRMQKDLLKAGFSLLVKQGVPVEIYKELTKTYEVAAVYTNRDYEPYANQRDQGIENYLKQKSVPFYTFKDHVIFEKKEILSEAGKPYKVFTPYKNKWLQKFHQIKIEPFSSDSLQSNFLKITPFSIPLLQELGFSPSPIQVPPDQLDDELIHKYDEMRDFPGEDGTSRVGIHLRHGSVSIRKIAVLANSLSQTWLNELIWREFYSMILYNFPFVVDRAFKSQYKKIPWRNNEEEFDRWCKGQTGYPLVDAGMRQLNETGFMHNRVRMVTASFLTKHLLIDWRWGEAYFASKLLDFELASNNGGWQWAAGTGTDAQPYFRIFNPASQTTKFDKGLKYIKEWVPEYNTPEYSPPIIDHKEARERALAVFKKALNV